MPIYNRFKISKQRTTCFYLYDVSRTIKKNGVPRQSSTFAGYIGLYLPSIKCHWEIEGAVGPLKTEPNENNISPSEDVQEIIVILILALNISSRFKSHPLKCSKGKPTALQTIS